MLGLLNVFLSMPPGMTGSNSLTLDFADHDDFETAKGLIKKNGWQCKTSVDKDNAPGVVYTRAVSFGEGSAVLLVRHNESYDGELVFHMEI